MTEKGIRCQVIFIPAEQAGLPNRFFSGRTDPSYPIVAVLSRRYQRCVALGRRGKGTIAHNFRPLCHGGRHISGEWGHVFYVMRDCQLSGTRDEGGDGELTGGGRRKKPN